LYSAINIFGLSFGIAIFLVLWSYIRFETGFDSIHSKGPLLYSVNTTLYSLDMQDFTAWDVGPTMKESIPGVKNFARLHWSGGLLILKGDHDEKKINVGGGMWFADNSIFEMFDFKPVAGNLSTALSQPYT